MASADATIPARIGASGTVAWLRQRGVYVALVVLVVFNVIFTPHYATTGTLTGTLIQATPVLLVSLGLTLVIATGGIDISVGAVVVAGSTVLVDPAVNGTPRPKTNGASCTVLAVVSRGSR